MGICVFRWGIFMTGFVEILLTRDCGDCLYLQFLVFGFRIDPELTMPQWNPWNCEVMVLIESYLIIRGTAREKYSLYPGDPVDFDSGSDSE
jgi:hypothetical protein